MNVYFISGMGADERIFKSVRLPEGFEPIFIKWIKPLRRESLTDYAERLTAQMDLSQPFAVAGLSLGGIMAVEIAKRHHAAVTILISSIPLSRQMPRYFLWARYLGLTRVVPVQFLKWLAHAKRTLTPETSEDKALIHRMIREADNEFLQWSVDSVLRWKNDVIPQPLYHIHGSLDEVFPLMKTKPTHVIRRGNHMLVMVYADRLNEFLAESLTAVAGDAGAVHRTAQATR